MAVLLTAAQDRDASAVALGTGLRMADHLRLAEELVNRFLLEQRAFQRLCDRHHFRSAWKSR
jgi:hypothetical protein